MPIPDPAIDPKTGKQFPTYEERRAARIAAWGHLTPTDLMKLNYADMQTTAHPEYPIIRAKAVAEFRKVTPGGKADKDLTVTDLATALAKVAEAKVAVAVEVKP
jgi:hypothetical protein